MATIPRTTSGFRSYEDFEPSFEWARDEKFETLLVKIPGFTKEQIKVQIDSYRNLRIRGERPLQGDRWSRFRQDFRIPEFINVSEIRAKFEDGVLYVIMPKLITEARAQEPPVSEMAAAETKRDETRAFSEPEATAQESGRRGEPVEPAKVKDQDQPKEPVDAGKKEPPAKEKVSSPRGGRRIIGDWPEKVRHGVGGLAESSGRGGRRIIGVWPEKVRHGAGGLAAGLKKRREFLLKVAVPIMVLVGLGMYLGYKMAGKPTLPVAESN